VSLRIGIDLGGTKIEGIVLDGSREAARLRVDTPREDYEATLAAIGSLIVSLEKLSNDGSRIPDPGSRTKATIGIGIPGTVSASTGLVKNANSTWLIGRPTSARPRASSAATDSPRERRELLCDVRGR